MPPQTAGYRTLLRASQVTRVADDVGVGVYFNTLVPWDDRVGGSTVPAVMRRTMRRCTCVRIGLL